MGRREGFLLWVLAGLLAWQASVFTYGVYLCAQVRPTADMKTVCPELGQRSDSFVNTSLGAVLGLLAGTLGSKP